MMAYSYTWCDNNICTNRHIVFYYRFRYTVCSLRTWRMNIICKSDYRTYKYHRPNHYFFHEYFCINPHLISNDTSILNNSFWTNPAIVSKAIIIKNSGLITNIKMNSCNNIIINSTPRSNKCMITNRNLFLLMKTIVQSNNCKCFYNSIISYLNIIIYNCRFMELLYIIHAMLFSE